MGNITCSEPIYHESDEEEEKEEVVKMDTKRRYSVRRLDTNTDKSKSPSSWTMPMISPHSTAKDFLLRQTLNRSSLDCVGPFNCATSTDDYYNEDDEELVMGRRVKKTGSSGIFLEESHSPKTVMEFPVSMELVLLEIISRYLIRRPYEAITEYLIPILSIQQAIMTQHYDESTHLHNSAIHTKDMIECDVTLKISNHIKKNNKLKKSYGQEGWEKDEVISLGSFDNTLLNDSPQGTHYYQISFKCMYTKYYNAFLERYPQYIHHIGLYDFQSYTTSNHSSNDNVIEISTFCNPTVPRRILSTWNKSSFLDLQISGSLGLFLPQKSFLIISNHNTGEPLTVCAFHKQGTKSKVRIFATKPRAKGQVSVCTTMDLGLQQQQQQQDRGTELHDDKYSIETHPTSSTSNKTGTPLFQWADIISEDGTFLHDGARFNTYMATGLLPGQVEEKPKFIATYATVGSPELVIFTRSTFEGPLEPCSVVMLQSDNSPITRKYGSSSYNTSNQFVMSIAKGIDPVMIVSITAVIEEITGYLIQQQTIA